MQAIEPSRSNTVDPDNEIDFKALGLSLWRHKLLILIAAVVTGLSALAISFVLPKTYSSEASLLPTLDSDPMASITAGLGSQLGGAVSMLGLGGLNGGRSADLVEILSSRTIAERVIARCNLEKEIKGWRYHDDLIKKVQKMVSITPPGMKNNVITIKVDAPRADLAAKVANTYISELKDMLDEMGYHKASKQRKFIESELVKTKTSLTNSENELTEFQTKNHISSLPQTVEAAIKSVSDLEAQRVNAQVQLKSTEEALNLVKAKSSTLEADPNSLLGLEVKRRGIQAQAAALDRAQNDFMNQLAALPPKGMELARLQRDVQVQNAIYLVLSQQHETALISESKDSDSFIPLDKAEAPDRPSKPKKLTNTLIGLLLGMVFGVVAALVKDKGSFGAIARFEGH